MKTLKIEIPQGYEIDKEKSTFENIVFKEIKKRLPKTWEELGRVQGYFVQDYSSITKTNVYATEENRNVFATKEQAEAAVAMAQLSQLMKVYNDGWKYNGDWYVAITFFEDEIDIDSFDKAQTFLSFRNYEIANLFLKNFRDLIIKAKPLL